MASAGQQLPPVKDGGIITGPLMWYTVALWRGREGEEDEGREGGREREDTQQSELEAVNAECASTAYAPHPAQRSPHSNGLIAAQWDTATAPPQSSTCQRTQHLAPNVRAPNPTGLIPKQFITASTGTLTAPTAIHTSNNDSCFGWAGPGVRASHGEP